MVQLDSLQITTSLRVYIYKFKGYLIKYGAFSSLQFFFSQRKVNSKPVTRTRGSTRGNRSDFSHARKAMTTQTLSQTVYGLRITKQTSSETECPFQCHFNSAILRYQCHCSNCMPAYFTPTHIETLYIIVVMNEWHSFTM